MHATNLYFLAKEGVHVLSQDLRFSLAFFLAGGAAATSFALVDSDAPALQRWGLGIGLPVCIFLGVSTWAALRVWRVVRAR